MTVCWGPLCYPAGSGLQPSPTPVEITTPNKGCNQELLLTLIQPKCSSDGMTLVLKKDLISVRERLASSPADTGNWSFCPNPGRRTNHIPLQALVFPPVEWA